VLPSTLGVEHGLGLAERVGACDPASRCDAERVLYQMREILLN
jgi:hypothetical protein